MLRFSFLLFISNIEQDIFNFLQLDSKSQAVIQKIHEYELSNILEQFINCCQSHWIGDFEFRKANFEFLNRTSKKSYILTVLQIGTNYLKFFMHNIKQAF